MNDPPGENPNHACEPPAEPDLIEASNIRPRWQFSLWWLFMLTTVVAAISAAVRAAMQDPLIAMGLISYATVIVFYLVFRLPMLMFYGPELRRIRENRRKLAQWASWKRDAKRAEESSRGE